VEWPLRRPCQTCPSLVSAMREVHVRKSDKRQERSENGYLLYLRGRGTRRGFGCRLNSGREARLVFVLGSGRVVTLCRSHLLLLPRTISRFNRVRVRAILMFNTTHLPVVCTVGAVDMAVSVPTLYVCTGHRVEGERPRMNSESLDIIRRTT